MNYKIYEILDRPTKDELDSTLFPPYHDCYTVRELLELISVQVEVTKLIIAKTRLKQAQDNVESEDCFLHN